MDLKVIEVKHNAKLVEDYLTQGERIQSFFDYPFNEQSAYQERLQSIHQRSYGREDLVRVLGAFNKKYTDHENVFANIEKLNNVKSAAVVGGQQAGLLTGPAYSIHKCISIIKLAREQEGQLGIPVIPIFWIAGEDHDFDEVNHVHIPADGGQKKLVYQKKFGNKTSVSKLTIDKADLMQWINAVFQAFGETDHTAQILTDLEEAVNYSRTVVDFFACLIHKLFAPYGLVLLDSADPAVRKLEAGYFQELLAHHKEINQAVISQLNHLEGSGYKVDLDQAEGNVNLFYDDKGNRELLEEDGNLIKGKSGTVRFDLSQLQGIAEETPEVLSNNVVTRPIMQDLLLPTLAFIAGPGEIAYWSALKKAFHQVSIDMPPVVPRLHMTLISRGAKKWLDNKELSIQKVLQADINQLKEEWLSAQHDWRVGDTVNTFRKSVKDAYGPMKELAVDISRGLDKISDKNIAIIERDIDVMEKKMMQMIELQYESELKRFQRVENNLCPSGVPQERFWSIFYFINRHGFGLIPHLLDQQYQFNGYQHVIEL
ncbi:bacillithiol biosynthesis cysteine-adding enzyme BshC [Scopulibacillus darangshiensis]|uniref:Putative cysteine ligase BshC n=1 Tax=Scopulibacillus darangshiensis TaxID=442528 RepID=A0A4R2P551_9BACL|nr:bacillithiol biosynthesis cysteine-adding enzyme BshC [Scopulibacillus darangshiensis]TCP29081.1 bacillithiol biosynthesis cysteine-adding enzyme BshC [Scopulibacillus darangshiensis]